MADEFHLDEVDFITIGTIGPPGQRVFHLQARQDDQLITFTLEKFQANAIGESLDTLLSQIAEEFSVETPEVDITVRDLALLEPILPVYRVGQIGLGYNAESDRVYLMLGELLPEDTIDEPRSAQIAATREQMRALALHTAQVVAQGRPICGNCGEPMDPEGHFCPKSNGHHKPVEYH